MTIKWILSLITPKLTIFFFKLLRCDFHLSLLTSNWFSIDQQKLATTDFLLVRLLFYMSINSCFLQDFVNIFFVSISTQLCEHFLDFFTTVAKRKVTKKKFQNEWNFLLFTVSDYTPAILKFLPRYASTFDFHVTFF